MKKIIKKKPRQFICRHLFLCSVISVFSILYMTYMSNKINKMNFKKQQNNEEHCFVFIEKKSLFLQFCLFYSKNI